MDALLRRSIRDCSHGLSSSLLPPRSTAFGLLKGNPFATAPRAESFVSDQDFSLRKTSHIINVIPPPVTAAARS
ncbi:hypothetical protein RJ55_04741 [Drechmeria coniospora]|nr:hypothetical protein RJ55_04741 [Drechmeria coniospora]